METTLKKKVSLNQMEKVFDKINIRYYEPVVQNSAITDFDEPINYIITIRHNENEDPKKLLNEAIKSL